MKTKRSVHSHLFGFSPPREAFGFRLGEEWNRGVAKGLEMLVSCCLSWDQLDGPLPWMGLLGFFWRDGGHMGESLK